MSQTDLRFYRQEEHDQSYIPLYSARGCKQTLEPINRGQTWRTISGELVFIGDQNFDKYISIIECDDVHPLSFDGLWLGTLLWVECIPRLMTHQLAKGSSTILKKVPVKGSLLLHQEDTTTYALPDCT